MAWQRRAAPRRRPEQTALRPLVDALVAAPLDQLGATGLQRELTVLTPQVARLQGWLTTLAGRLDALTAGSVTDADTGRPRTVAGWLAQVQHATAGSAGSQLRTARLLRELPLVVDAVLDGVLTPQQAAVLTRLVGKIDADGLVESQPYLIQVAAAMDPHQLGMWVAHQIATHCEPALEDDDTRARDKRYLTHRREADGALFGRFRITGEDSEALLTALEPLARKAGDDDTRTAGQRRADALDRRSPSRSCATATCPTPAGYDRSCPTSCPPTGPPAKPTATPAPACGPRCADHQPLTFTDTVAAAMPGQGGIRAEQACATAAWTGPQTRSRIEALLCDARITRVLLCPRGQVTGFQPLRDSITPAQRRNLAARDLHCVVRGCTRPPAMCDAHHLRRRADGGETTMDNLVLLCRRHHVLWHLGKIQLRHLTVPWHEQQQTADPPPEPLADLFAGT